jgi:hypothetical protein
VASGVDGREQLPVCGPARQNYRVWRVRQVFVGIVAVSVLIVLSGCSVLRITGGGVATAPCEPGVHSPGQSFVATDGAGNEVDMVAGECFDTWTVGGALGLDEADQLAVTAACDSLGLEHQLNSYLGHGVRQIARTITGMEADQGIRPTSGMCAFNLPLDEWALDNLVGITFNFTGSDSIEDPAFYREYSWNSLVESLGGAFEPLEGHGIRAGVIDSISNGGDDYTVFAQGEGGEIVRVVTYFPESRRDEQLQVNQELALWLEAGLKAAATLNS